MKHVVNLSGGACSFWAADRVANKFGTADLTLLFADVLIEDPQLYKLNEWTAEYFGVPITRVSREITPWDLFRLEGMIGNDRAPICSIRLKREVLEAWQLKHCTPRDSLFGEPDTIYVGLDWSEINMREIPLGLLPLPVEKCFDQWMEAFAKAFPRKHPVDKRKAGSKVGWIARRERFSINRPQLVSHGE